MGNTAMQLQRTRQLKKAFQNFVLTVVCAFTTILVLKGSTGFENPSSSDYYESQIPAHSQKSFYFTNRNRPLIRFKNPQSRNPHFRTNHDRNPNFLSNHDRSLHKLQNPRSQIPFLPSNNDGSASESQVIRSELQRTRLLSEVNNLPTEKENNPLHSDNPHPNPSPNPNLIRTENPNPNSNLRPNPNQDTNQMISKASDNQDLHNPDEFLSISDDRKNESEFHKPSILLVTGSQPLACNNPLGDYYLMKSLKNKMDYCRLHDLDIFYNMANLDPQMSGFWAKLPLIYTLMLAHPEKEWLWWVDSDAMITDMAFEIPMERYEGYNLVLHGWKELVYEQKNWVGLNTGSFLIRNCEWSLNLLEAWAPMGPKGKVREEAGHLLSKALVGRPQFEADDQSALIYLLNEQKSKWASKVYLENAYYLHGYWLLIVDKYEEMMEKYHSGLGDERWPFVTHFVGCKPCSNKKHVALEDKCVEHMERAFNFADNQVLQFYGFQHESLNTHTLLRSADSS